LTLGSRGGRTSSVGPSFDTDAPVAVAAPVAAGTGWIGFSFTSLLGRLLYHSSLSLGIHVLCSVGFAPSLDGGREVVALGGGAAMVY
jgi:hypothetical protein